MPFYALNITTAAFLTGDVLAGADDEQSHFQSALVNAVRNCETTYELYAAVADFVTAQAENYPAFLPECLRDVSVDRGGSAPNTVLAFEMSDAAIERRLRDVAREMRDRMLGHFDALLTDDPLRQRIVAIFGKEDTQIYQSSGGPLAGDLAAASRKLSGLARTDPDINDLNAVITICREAADLLLKKQPLMSTEAAKVSTQNNAGVAAVFLNDKSFPGGLRKNFADYIVDAMVDECTKRKTKTRQKLGMIFDGFGIPGEHPGQRRAGSEEFKRFTGILRTHFKNKVEDGPVRAEDLSDELLCFGVVLPTACHRLTCDIAYEIGHSDVAQIRSLDYEFKDAEAEIAQLMPEVLAAIESVFEKLVVQVYWKTNPTTAELVVQLQALKPLVLYDLAEYTRHMNKRHVWVKEISATAYDTPCNTLDLPLQSLSGGSIRFYNCADRLYLSDATTPRVYNVIVAGVRTDGVDLFKGTDPVTQRDKVVTFWPEPAFNRPARSRWFNFQRTFVVLYAFEPRFIGPIVDYPGRVYSHMMWLKSTGSGSALFRSDEIVTGQYRWAFTGDIGFLRQWMEKILPAQSPVPQELTVAKLGAYLDLDPELRLVNYNPNFEVAANGFGYTFVDVEGATQTDPDERYVLCQTPYVAPPITIKSPAVLNDLLEKFQFLYFRRVWFGGPKLASQKVVKTSNKPKNPPKWNNVLPEYYSQENQVIGLNLPISLQIARNLRAFQQWKSEAAVIKNKGNILKANHKFRKDAGKVMAALPPYAKGILGAGDVSARTLADAVWDREGTAKAEWKKLKLARGGYLPPSQEWCHLMGHGDGGDERTGNFVAGSYHCNTEQLAIESAQRPTTHAAKDVYMLKSSAYLWPDDSMELLKGSQSYKSYLSHDSSSILNAYTKNPKNPLLDPDAAAKREEEFRRAGTNAPVAAFIRYKVFQRIGTSDKFQKLFDYVFEGQSEFFDRNQCNILNYTVKFLLDTDGFVSDLADYLSENMSGTEGMVE